MQFYDEEALLQRLSAGIRKRAQEVVFLVGAPVSAPVSIGSPGVPGVDGVIRLIRKEFEGDAGELLLFDTEVADSGARKYQAAFIFLQGRRGQTTANEIIRNAVLGARLSGAISIPIDSSSQFGMDSACQTLDSDIVGWNLTPSLEGLGKLVAKYPNTFGKVVLRRISTL
jgi:hypothetical protein